MAGVSVISKAKQHVMSVIPAARTPETFGLARRAMKQLVDAANERRLAYKSNAKARALIQATEDGAWKLYVVMGEVEAQWAAAEPQLESILVTLFMAVKHIDGTPPSAEQEPNADMVKQVAATAVEAIRAKLPQVIRPLDEIGQAMAQLVAPSARIVDPQMDPDDVLEPENRIGTVQPDVFSPDTFDWSKVKP